MPAERRPALERLAALQGGVDAPGPQRRRPRGPAPSSRSRIRVSDGAFPTPNGARRFRARTGSSPPRTCRPDCRSDGIPGEKTASPDVRPTGRLKSRVPVGSGMRSKHARTARSTALASTDACERNLWTFFCSAFACLTAAKPIRRERSVTGKFVTAVQPADNERKEILSGIADLQKRREPVSRRDWKHRGKAVSPTFHPQACRISRGWSGPCTRSIVLPVHGAAGGALHGREEAEGRPAPAAATVGGGPCGGPPVPHRPCRGAGRSCLAFPA